MNKIQIIISVALLFLFFQNCSGPGFQVDTTLDQSTLAADTKPLATTTEPASTPTPATTPTPAPTASPEPGKTPSNPYVLFDEKSSAAVFEGQTFSVNKLCYPSDGQEFAVSPSTLQERLDSARPGDVLELEAGTYTDKYTFAADGTEAKPIRIKAAAGAIVTFTGNLEFKGSYAVLEGLNFVGNNVALPGHHHRVTKSKFSNSNQIPITMLGPNHSYNRIDHNEFRNIQEQCIEISADGDASLHQGHRVDHNYFVDHKVGAFEETIRMLTDAKHDSFFMIDHNVFDNVLINKTNQSEAISVKTARTAVLLNTFINSKINLSLRMTNRSLVLGNYLDDGAGITVMGDDHTVAENIVETGMITVGAGDGTMDSLVFDSPVGWRIILSNGLGSHGAARNSRILNNSGMIQVGAFLGKDGFQIFPSENNLIVNHQGPVSLLKDQTGTKTIEGKVSPRAIKLKTTDVGPNSTDLSCR